VPSAAYTCALSWDERKKRLEEFRNGHLKVLAVMDVFNEGADLPVVECLLFLRPTESKRIFFQQLGRGLRRYPGKASCLWVLLWAQWLDADWKSIRGKMKDWAELLSEKGTEVRVMKGRKWLPERSENDNYLANARLNPRKSLRNDMRCHAFSRC
jgi:superfamily II DNA or RNA helicase